MAEGMRGWNDDTSRTFSEALELAAARDFTGVVTGPIGKLLVVGKVYFLTVTDKSPQSTSGIGT